QYLNLIPRDAHFERVGFDARIVAPRAVADPKAPSVPGARDDAVFQRAVGQRRAHMRAEIVDGAILSAAQIEHRHQLLTHGEGGARALGDLADLGDSDELGHRWKRALSVAGRRERCGAGAAPAMLYLRPRPLSGKVPFSRRFRQLATPRGLSRFM